MPVDHAFITRLERQLEAAKAQLLQEDGERYRILMREISETEKQRILDGLTDHRERVLFGLEAPEEPRGPATGKTKTPADLTCELCGKSGLSRRGLSLHIARVHKGERTEGAEAAA